MIPRDTHVLIWLAQGDPKLGGEARQVCRRALEEERLLVSAISLWETAMLERRGRVRLVEPVEVWRDKVLGLGVEEVPVTGEVGIAAARIEDFHQDPADRILVGTVRLAGAALLTADRRILGWPGALERLDARV